MQTRTSRPKNVVAGIRAGISLVFHIATVIKIMWTFCRTDGTPVFFKLTILKLPMSNSV